MFGVLVVMLLIAIWQIPILLQEKNYKELVYFLILWVISGGYALILVMGIRLLSPFQIIDSLMAKITTLF